MFEVIVATAVGTIVAIGLAGLARNVWANRRRPIDWVASGKEALAARRRRLERAKHDQLVRWVIARAEELRLGPGEDVPLEVSGRNPARITFHPTGRVFSMFRDFESYRAAAESGRVNPTQAHYGVAPRAVGQWTADELRSWLFRHDTDSSIGD